MIDAAVDPSCCANIEYAARTIVRRFSPSAHVAPTRGVTEFHTIASSTGDAVTAGSRFGKVVAAGTDVAPSDEAWRSQRSPAVTVKRSRVHVSATYALDEEAS